MVRQIAKGRATQPSAVPRIHGHPPRFVAVYAAGYSGPILSDVTKEKLPVSR